MEDYCAADKKELKKFFNDPDKTCDMCGKKGPHILPMTAYGYGIVEGLCKECAGPNWHEIK